MARKKAIPVEVRRAILLEHGISKPNIRTPVRCHYCDFVGYAMLDKRPHHRSVGWPVLSGLEYDHFWPEHLGGEANAWNIVLACRACNRSKGHKRPLDWAPWLAHVNEESHGA